MIQVCPNCGHMLPQQLNDGLSHCSHCNQVFDSSDFNQLLAAAWQVRKDKMSLDEVKWHLKLGEEFSIFVHTFAGEYDYTHEEFIRLLKKFGVAHKSYINFS